jgi:hypothetical protein
LEAAIAVGNPLLVFPETISAEYVRTLLAAFQSTYAIEEFGLSEWMRISPKPQREETRVSLAQRVRELRDDLGRRRDASTAAAASRPWLLWLRVRPDPAKGDAPPLTREDLHQLEELSSEIIAARSSDRVLLSGIAMERFRGDPIFNKLHRVPFSRPSGDSIEVFLKECASDEGAAWDNAMAAKVANELTLLPLWEVSDIVRRVTGAYPGHHARQLEEVTRIRIANVKKLLEPVHVPTRYTEQVGGMAGLRDWLAARVDESIRQKLGPTRSPAPKALMLNGVPGMGKSVAAKLCAYVLGVPLWQLHADRMYGQFVGQSEANLREALSEAESAAPCVLWIDEFEKGFSRSADDKTSASLIGIWLKWLEQRPGRAADVLVVATINSDKDLPPALLRTGRFERFWFGYPPAAVRVEIAEATLRAIDEQSGSVRRFRLADSSKNWLKGKEIENYNASELARLVREAVNARLDGDGGPSQKDILEVGELKQAAKNMKAQAKRPQEKRAQAISALPTGYMDAWAEPAKVRCVVNFRLLREAPLLEALMTPRSEGAWVQVVAAENGGHRGSLVFDRVRRRVTWHGLDDKVGCVLRAHVEKSGDGGRVGVFLGKEHSAEECADFESLRIEEAGAELVVFNERREAVGRVWQECVCYRVEGCSGLKIVKEPPSGERGTTTYRWQGGVSLRIRVFSGVEATPGAAFDDLESAGRARWAPIVIEMWSQSLENGSQSLAATVVVRGRRTDNRGAAASKSGSFWCVDRQEVEAKLSPAERSLESVQRILEGTWPLLVHIGGKGLFAKGGKPWPAKVTVESA